MSRPIVGMRMEHEDTSHWSLEQKEAKSLEVIKEALQRSCGRVATTFTGGKDSLTVLHMLKRIGEGRVRMPVLNIDTTVKFQEVMEFRDRMALEWDLDLIVVTNYDGLKKINIAEDHEQCCLVMKAEATDMALKEHGWKALITCVRWDEHPARISEDYFSERPGHTRVQPILHFSELDIWAYIEKYRLPYCRLYDQGYRSLGCEPCTVRSVRPRGDGPEREGRSQEKEQMMAKLRGAGYF